MPHKKKTGLTDHILIPGIGLELACNRGSRRRISLKRDLMSFAFEKTPTLASVASWFHSSSENMNMVC